MSGPPMGARWCVAQSKQSSWLQYAGDRTPIGLTRMNDP